MHDRDPVRPPAVLPIGHLDRGQLGGSGGLVTGGRDGALPLPFNCSGIYRGYVKRGHVKADGIVYTAICDEAYRSA